MRLKGSVWGTRNTFVILSWICPKARYCSRISYCRLSPTVNKLAFDLWPRLLFYRVETKSFFLTGGFFFVCQKRCLPCCHLNRLQNCYEYWFLYLSFKAIRKRVLFSNVIIGKPTCPSFFFPPLTVSHN